MKYEIIMHIIGMSFVIIGILTYFSAHPAIAQEAFTVRELPCARGGMTIYGKAYIPRGRGRRTAVIISHGFGGTHASSAPYAEAFAKSGVASYIFDFCGGSDDSKSGGSMLEMSVLTEADDLNAVIDFVETLDFVDADNLFLMGRSQGGYVSALVASRRMAEVRGLVLLYPAFVIDEDMRRLRDSEDGIPERHEIMGSAVGRVYFEDALKVDIYNEIKGYGRDVLIMHGDMDETVPVSCSERAAEIYESAELVVLEGAGHGFQGTQLAWAVKKALEYIAGHRR
ncbi:MAG: alpha/beta hydrolase [Synergistaceae bacterium]|jgi:pimeloyl-ACP methyl ester carboxylesterase|nr:alpha/beta hydrolase [Synergistaceae bacterium]